MPVPSTLSVAVIGCGIAGAATAHALAARGADVVLCAPERGTAASHVPVAVAQPVMGRRASASSLRLRGFDAARRLIDRVASDDRHVVRARGLLRVAIDEDRAAEYARRADRLPAEVAEFLDADGCTRRLPGVSDVRCGIWIPEAVAVHLPSLVARLATGLPRIARRIVAIEPGPSGVRVRDDAGGSLEVDRVVVAAGASTPGLLAPWQSPEPFRSELHGEVITLATPAPPPAMVGETGQVVPLSPRRVAVTASQREGGSPPAHDGVTTLRERAARAWPALEGARVIGVWSGRRLTTKDAHPLVGPVETTARVWTVSGLGSRGLLFGSLAAEQIAEALVADGDVLESVWSPGRRSKTTNPHSGG